jgi:hypothetical protein
MDLLVQRYDMRLDYSAAQRTSAGTMLRPSLRPLWHILPSQRTWILFGFLIPLLPTCIMRHRTIVASPTYDGPPSIAHED